VLIGSHGVRVYVKSKLLESLMAGRQCYIRTVGNRLVNKQPKVVAKKSPRQLNILAPMLSERFNYLL